ncbi:MAG TPA: tRNA pseudouridine(13) synthase TruD [Candidatus Bathyarchaeia archaeon]|nr:tRNA pseudouridine(13) synthase TruD [Candidatus Bathyarchaeia archaeon]
MTVPLLEKRIGIEVYATKSQGIGGKLRHFPEDFKVEEILTNGSTAKIEPNNMPIITGHGRYLIHVLVKCNVDTFQAVQIVANKLGINVERIQIGGIKDAKALTAQHISVSRMLPEQATQIKTTSLWVYPLLFSNEKMDSSMLFGNNFHINIRAINHPASAITKRLENVNRNLLKLGGCPNFFGHQRFGTIRAITHLVGKDILLGEWEKAALTFLAKPSVLERPESRQARQQLWNTQDYESALRYFPPRLVYERQMLKHLAQQHRDFIGAFHRLPIKLCQLFIQAYQSYLFNRFLSQRIMHGLPLKKPRANEYRLTIDSREHVALPLIGYRQGISGGLQGEIEKTLLEEEVVPPDKFKIPAMPRISSSGGVRTALTEVIDLHLERPSRDETNISRKKIGPSFTLRKGSYATVVLREFMKPRNPVKAGF